MVEDSFSQLPTWHPSVRAVIPVATRRWRKLNWQNVKEAVACFRLLRRQKYDIVIDAQGLMKSAVLARFARLNKGGVRVGFSADSIKESLAARFYKRKISVAREQHAIYRLRQLFAQAFGYSVESDTDIDYKLQLPGKPQQSSNRRTVFFLHGTTWPRKHLPDQMWRDLLDLVTDDGYQVKLCWGNQIEEARAQWIAQHNANAQVLPKQSLLELARQIQGAASVVAVDTGLGHLAAALGVPGVSVYGASDAKLTSALGTSQVHIQVGYPCSPCLLKRCDKITTQVTNPPCYQTLTASDIWQPLYQLIA